MNKYTYKPPCDKESLERMYNSGMSQTECAKKLGVSQKIIFTAMKHYGIKSRKAAPRDQKGTKNNNWKGDNAGKQAFHRRLYAKYGKPRKCHKCGTIDQDKSYDYANLTGNYQDINDYMPMCRSCHWKYDKKILNIKHMRRDSNESS